MKPLKEKGRSIKNEKKNCLLEQKEYPKHYLQEDKMEKKLAFMNVPVSDLVNIQHDCGTAIAKDLYILFIELWRRDCDPLPINIAQKKLKININRLKKCANDYPNYVNFDDNCIESEFIFTFFNQNLRKKQSRENWNEKRRMLNKQQDTINSSTDLKAIINNEK